MRPKSFDTASRRADFLNDEAINSERRAYELECFADFYDEWDAASDLKSQDARDKAEKARRYADIAISRAKPSQKQITETRRTFLDNWLDGNRQRILEHTERISIKEEAGLEEYDEPPITEDIVQPDGKTFSKAVTIKEHRDLIEMFEAAVKVAERKFGELPEPKRVKADPKVRKLRPEENGAKEDEKVEAEKG